jgi:hypothetical protein
MEEVEEILIKFYLVRWGEGFKNYLYDVFRELIIYITYNLFYEK